MKALIAYSQHCRGKTGDAGNESTTVDQSKERLTSQNCRYLLSNDSVTGCQSASHSKFENDTPLARSGETSHCLKMAQCRLKYYDDPGTGRSIENRSKSPLTSRTSPLLYSLQDADGVLADAVGHVYKSTHSRPWSVLPGRLSDFVKVNRHGVCFVGGKRYLQIY